MVASIAAYQKMTQQEEIAVLLLMLFENVKQGVWGAIYLRWSAVTATNSSSMAKSTQKHRIMEMSMAR